MDSSLGTEKCRGIVIRGQRERLLVNNSRELIIRIVRQQQAGVAGHRSAGQGRGRRAGSTWRTGRRAGTHRPDLSMWQASWQEVGASHRGRHSRAAWWGQGWWWPGGSRRSHSPGWAAGGGDAAWSQGRPRLSGQQAPWCLLLLCPLLLIFLGFLVEVTQFRKL